MDNVIRAYEALIDSVSNDDMSIVARINTASVDRYQTVIDPRGGRFDNFRKLGAPNLWEHGKDPRRHTDPIANSQWIRTDGGQVPKQILAKPVFLGDDFSRQRWEWYRDGIIKGWSVNILPDGNISPPSKEELRSRPDWEAAQLVYRSWDLAEFSGTVIPGNAECLTADRTAKIAELVQRGLVWLPDEAKPFYADAFQAKNAPPEKRSARYIEDNGAQWAIYEPSGEYIAAFPFKDLAERCLAAMESPVAWTDIHDRMASEQMRRNLDITGDIQAMLELALLGKV
jgi:hypothetical protein